MKIPKKIKIGWKEYAVMRIKPNCNFSLKENPPCGQIFYDELEIRINSEYCKESQNQTFIHEAVHGISEMYGLGFDEKTVEIFSNGLYALIKDNPKLFKK